VSKKHFTRYFRNLTPIELTVRAHGHFTFELYGLAKNEERTPVLILESGFNCGYGGEGPHGTISALKQLGITNKELEGIVTTFSLIIVDFRGKPRIGCFEIGGLNIVDI